MRYLLAVLPLFFVGKASGQVPFLRGDVNDDGRVSIADAYHILLWVHGSGPIPLCVKAADADDDGKVSTRDHVNGLFVGSDVSAILAGAVEEPQRVPGDDPTPDDLACEAYSGKTPPANDPAARLEIPEAFCPGGSNALAVLKVRISHSVAIGGYAGVLDGLGIFTEAVWRIEVDGSPIDGVSRRRAELRNDGTIYFAQLEEYSGRLGSLPAATDHVVMKLYLRLAAGLPAGDYPLVLLDGELAESSTGRAIVPVLGDGNLHVQEAVAADAEVIVNPAGHWECEAGEPFPPTGPEDVQAAFSLALIPSEPAVHVTMPVWLEANAPIQGFQFAVLMGGSEFEGHTRFERVSPVLQGDVPWESFDHEILSPSFVRGTAVFGTANPPQWLAPGIRHHVLDLEISIDAGAPVGQIHMTLVDLTSNPEQPQIVGPTAVMAFGQVLRRSMVTCLSMREEQWGIILGGNETSYLRGDANRDGAISLGDSMLIGHHFRRGAKLLCEDAGDANDDGGRNVGDAIHLIEHLFESTPDKAEIPPPFPGIGQDPTLDPLPCEEYRVTPARQTEDLMRIGSVEAAPGEWVEVPVFATTSLPLEALVLLVKYDPVSLTPVDGLRDALRLDGGLFDAYRGFEGAFLNVLRTDLLPGHGVFALAPDLFRPPAVPAGRDALIGTFTVQASAELQPGQMLEILPVGSADGEPPHPSRLRSETIVAQEGTPVTLLPRLESGLLRIVAPGEATFLRGDANGDLEVNISDPVFTLGYLFLGGETPSCLDAVDSDDSGRIELTDAVFTLSFLFGSETARQLPIPYPAMGRDGEPDALPPCR